MGDVVTWLIDISGLQVAQDGVYIYLKNDHWIMTPECTALSAMIDLYNLIQISDKVISY